MSSNHSSSNNHNNNNSNNFNDSSSSSMMLDAPSDYDYDYDDSAAQNNSHNNRRRRKQSSAAAASVAHKQHQYQQQQQQQQQLSNSQQDSSVERDELDGAMYGGDKLPGTSGVEPMLLPTAPIQQLEPHPAIDMPPEINIPMRSSPTPVDPPTTAIATTTESESNNNQHNNNNNNNNNTTQQPERRPDILSRMISQHDIDMTGDTPGAAAIVVTNDANATALMRSRKVKTKLRALSMMHRDGTPVDTVPPLSFEPAPATTLVDPTAATTTTTATPSSNRKKKKSSKRKSERRNKHKDGDDGGELDDSNVLPLTEQNLDALTRGEPLGPLFQRSRKTRSKSPGKRRSKSRRAAAATALSNIEQQKPTTPYDSTKHNRQVKLRVIGQVEYTKNTNALPEEDAPVTASFCKILKNRSANGNWGALAKELAQGIHSVEIPKLAFSDPTSREDVITFGATKRAILMGHADRERHVYRMHDFLVTALGFDDETHGTDDDSIVVLLDPSRAEILVAMQTMAMQLQGKDSSLLIYYVGHDLDSSALSSSSSQGSENQKSDATIFIPSDYDVAGPVTESDFWDHMVRPLTTAADNRKSVEITCLFDCHLPKGAFDLNHKIKAPPPLSSRRASIASNHQDEKDMMGTLGGMLQIATNLADIKPPTSKPKKLSLPAQTTIRRSVLQGDRARRESRRNALASLLNTERHYGAHARFQLITVPGGSSSNAGAVAFEEEPPGETTSAFVKVLTDLETHRITIESLLFHMRMQLSSSSTGRTSTRIPQISGSRPIDFHEPFTVIQPGGGVQRALLIGVNYNDRAQPNSLFSDEEWDGAHLDLIYFKAFIHETYGFMDKNCVVLMDDDGRSEPPTRENILGAMKSLVNLSEPGDSVVVYFAGRGGYQDQVETILPVDGLGISGEDLWDTFVAPMAEGVQITCVIDAPTLEGSVLELPYSFEADDEQAKVFIPATVHVVGGSNGRITKPFLHSIDERNQPLWFPTLDKMHEHVFDSASPNREPILSSSRRLHDQSKINMMPNEGYGAKRALLIGINYIGVEGMELQHCHEDLEGFKWYLQNQHGLTPNDWTVLQDRGSATRPTYRNITHAIQEMVTQTQPGDSLFFYYCGHGSAILDKKFGSDIEHPDGIHKWEDALVPSDIDDYGRNSIVDDDLLNLLVRPLPEGSTLTCVVDCYKSHSAVNLPYTYRPPKPEKADTMRSTSPFRRLSLGNALFQRANSFNDNTSNNSSSSNHKRGSIAEIFNGAWSSLKEETHSVTGHTSATSLDLSGSNRELRL